MKKEDIEQIYMKNVSERTDTAPLKTSSPTSSQPLRELNWQDLSFFFFPNQVLMSFALPRHSP